MEEKLVSVILPCFNSMPYLPEAVNSIINQTYKNLEIIISNDGSTDKTEHYLEHIAKKDNRIKIIHNDKNIGLIRTLNNAIKEAKGDFIARMDADDISVLHRIEKQMDYLNMNPEIDIVSCGAYLISADGKTVGKNYPRQFSSFGSLMASFFFRPIGHAELLAKAEVLKTNPYLYEEKSLHVEDYELWSRLLKKGYKLANQKELLYYVRINPSSVSRKFTDLQIENFIACAKSHYQGFFIEYISLAELKVLANRLSSDITTDELKGGFIKLKGIRKFFINKNKGNHPQYRKEINTIYYTHVIDVCLQALKRIKGNPRKVAFYHLLQNLHALFIPSVFNYLLRKIV